jgi:hypothetical protein
MHEQHSESVRPDLPPEAVSRAENIFVTKKRFPGEVSVPEVRPSIAAPPRKRSLGSRLLVPMILFVAVVGGIAWIVQYVPNWRKKTDVKPLPAVEKPALLFTETMATWEPEDEKKPYDERYAKEYERGAEGRYDYPFDNTLSEPAEVGLLETSCDCTSVLAAALSPEQVAEWEKVQKERPKGIPDEITEKFSWKTLERGQKNGLVVPAGAKGLVRVSWKGRKNEGQQLRLSVALWMQPEGRMRERNFVRLETPTLIVAPLRFSQSRLNLGVVEPGTSHKGEVDCWSSTRPHVELTLNNKDPLLDWRVRPLSEPECRILEKKLRHDGVNTHVQCAFHISVTLHEDKDGKRFDQGPFERQAPVVMDGQLLGAAAPLVYGSVHGEVQVGSGNDLGKVNLSSFSARDGISRQVLVWAKKGTRLALDKERTNPPFLRAQLEENPSSSTANKSCWLLKVEILPGCPAGPLPGDSAVLLRRTDGAQAAPARYIRIPVTGTAVQG